MNQEVIGLLHPGAMGSSIGAAAKTGRQTVLWASEGRSKKSAERAGRAGLEDSATLDDLVARSAGIISVCPPASAVEVAAAVMDRGFGGIYLDANAISPRRSREIGNLAEKAGCDYVDGGIVGGPAWRSGTTWLYLSGPEAHHAATWFEGSNVTVANLGDLIGSASALKMAYAAYTKGTTALVCAILALAEKEGVIDALFEQWEISQKVLAETAKSRATNVTEKAWRFSGEMREIAQTFQDASLPGGFHNAAAEIYDRLAHFKESPSLPTFAEVLKSINADGNPEKQMPTS